MPNWEVCTIKFNQETQIIGGIKIEDWLSVEGKLTLITIAMKYQEGD